MIHFSDSEVQAFWESEGRMSRPFAGYANVLMRKLRMIDAAKELYDLRVPPGNKLEALHGDREGQYSIRINVQFRICFIWTEEGARNVEVVDYH
jgi:toxin HigB-1